jgi:hypothetical protein
MVAPVILCAVKIQRDAQMQLPVPNGHNSAAFVRSDSLRVEVLLVEIAMSNFDRRDFLASAPAVTPRRAGTRLRFAEVKIVRVDRVVWQMFYQSGKAITCPAINSAP